MENPFRIACVIYIFLILEVCSHYNYETRYFKQKIDQFGFANEDTYMQKYLINVKAYSQHNGTIFFYCGNEGKIEMFANNAGFIWEHAALFNAAIVFAEHRYYGDSLPYGNLSYYDNTYRGYLTSQQALADYAELITHIKHKLPGGKNVPVIAFGGSYGGMLSAWIRIKYPHIITGAIASSAPIWMFPHSDRCEMFSKIVTQSFAMHGEACSALIRYSWHVIKQIGSTTQGAKWLGGKFHLCDDIDKRNVSGLIDWIKGTWSYLAMTNYPYPTKFLQPIPANPVKEVCSCLTNVTSFDNSTLIDSIYKGVSIFKNYSGDVDCFKLQDDVADLGEKGWSYQNCNEMVMPDCSTGIQDMFEPEKWDVTKFKKECYRDWKIEPEMRKLRIIYGGKNIKASSNIIFTNGDLDPWKAGGVLESLSNTLIAINIENAAHHLDLRSSNSADPPSVIKARLAILHWIKKWIYSDP